VFDFWGDIIQSLWEKIKPLIVDMRKDSGDLNMFGYWEFLFEKMKKKKQKPQPTA
jgi:hypothetical protein